MVTLAGCSQPGRTAREPVGTRTTTTQSSSRAQGRTVQRNCDSCGVVASITAIRTEGGTTGAGTVIGAIVGGLVGNQVGGGDGKKIATVAGAIGGGVVGNKIEEGRNNETYYEVVVDMETGGRRTVNIDNASGLNVGSRVNVQGNDISLR
jgi:uncharacterized protein YcfJ